VIEDKLSSRRFGRNCQMSGAAATFEPQHQAFWLVELDKVAPEVFLRHTVVIL
jgi:hypothetical protein